MRVRYADSRQTVRSVYNLTGRSIFMAICRVGPVSIEALRFPLTPQYTLPRTRISSIEYRIVSYKNKLSDPYVSLL